MTPAVVLGSLAMVSAVAGAGSSRAWAAEAAAAAERAPESAAARPGMPFAEKFPNLVLKTHQGENVRFYDDLLKDKVVLINFFYVTCEER